MITSLLLEGIVGLVEWLLGLLPDWDVPAFLSSLPGYAADAGESASLLGHWVPIGLVVDLAQALTTLWLALIAVRGARRVVSLVTGGGGG